MQLIKQANYHFTRTAQLNTYH